ncbi:MAG: hypothetical protein R3Y13_03980 [bacterium]
MNIEEVQNQLSIIEKNERLIELEKAVIDGTISCKYSEEINSLKNRLNSVYEQMIKEKETKYIEELTEYNRDIDTAYMNLFEYEKKLEIAQIEDEENFLTSIKYILSSIDYENINVMKIRYNSKKIGGSSEFFIFGTEKKLKKLLENSEKLTKKDIDKYVKKAEIAVMPVIRKNNRILISNVEISKISFEFKSMISGETPYLKTLEKYIDYIMRYKVEFDIEILSKEDYKYLNKEYLEGYSINCENKVR